MDPVFSVSKGLISRTDEHGNITTWRLLSAPKLAPKMSTGLPYEALAVSTFNGKHERQVIFRFDTGIYLAWLMISEAGSSVDEPKYSSEEVDPDHHDVFPNGRAGREVRS